MLSSMLSFWDIPYQDGGLRMGRDHWESERNKNRGIQIVEIVVMLGLIEMSAD